MAKLSSFKSNLKLEEHGVWVNFGGIEFLIARMGNPKYQAEVRRLMKAKAVMAGIARNNLDQEVLEAINDEAAASSILLDWKNMEDDNGVAIQATFEERLKLIKSPEYHEVWSFIQQCAMNGQLFKDAVEQADLKNS